MQAIASAAGFSRGKDALLDLSALGAEPVPVGVRCVSYRLEDSLPHLSFERGHIGFAVCDSVRFHESTSPLSAHDSLCLNCIPQNYLYDTMCNRLSVRFFQWKLPDSINVVGDGQSPGSARNRLPQAWDAY